MWVLHTRNLNLPYNCAHRVTQVQWERFERINSPQLFNTLIKSKITYGNTTEIKFVPKTQTVSVIELEF